MLLLILMICLKAADKDESVWKHGIAGNQIVNV